MELISQSVRACSDLP